MAVNTVTSCQFASNVAKEYEKAAKGSDEVVITAYSPTTKKDYIMTCQSGQVVICAGGEGAEVYLLR